MATVISKSRLLFALRLVFAATLLFLIFRLVDLQSLSGALASVRPEPILGSLFLMLANYCFKTYRWALLLWIRRPDIPFIQLARFNFVSIFLGSLLPSSLSADVVRIYYVSRYASDPRPAISSLIVDRMIGTFALALVTLVAFLTLLYSHLIPVGLAWSYSIVVALVVMLLIPLTLSNTTFLRAIVRVFEFCTGKELHTLVQDIFDHFRSYTGSVLVLTKVLSLAVLNLVIAALEFYLIAKGLGAQVSLTYFLLFVPLVIFLATLPVSIGGLGLVEGGLLFFFSRVGLALEVCLATALLYRTLQLACMIPGAVLYLLNGFAVRTLPDSLQDHGAPAEPSHLPYLARRPRGGSDCL